MKIIRKLSYKAAHYLSTKLNEPNEMRRIYYYGLQIIIGEAVKYILFLSVVMLLDILKESLTILIFYAPIRIIAGGYHMKDHTRCMVTSFALFIASAFALKNLDASLPVLMVISLVTVIASLYVAYRWAPQPAFPKSTAYMKKIKWLTIALILAWFILNCYFIIRSNLFWIQAGISGILLSDLALSPLCSYIFKRFDKR